MQGGAGRAGVHRGRHVTRTPARAGRPTAATRAPRGRRHRQNPASWAARAPRTREHACAGDGDTKEVFIINAGRRDRRPRFRRRSAARRADAAARTARLLGPPSRRPARRRRRRRSRGRRRPGASRRASRASGRRPSTRRAAGRPRGRARRPRRAATIRRDVGSAASVATSPTKPRLSATRVRRTRWAGAKASTTGRGRAR